MTTSTCTAARASSAVGLGARAAPSAAALVPRRSAPPVESDQRTSPPTIHDGGAVGERACRSARSPPARRPAAYQRRARLTRPASASFDWAAAVRELGPRGVGFGEERRRGRRTAPVCERRLLHVIRPVDRRAHQPVQLGARRSPASPAAWIARWRRSARCTASASTSASVAVPTSRRRFGARQVFLGGGRRPPSAARRAAFATQDAAVELRDVRARCRPRLRPRAASAMSRCATRGVDAGARAAAVEEHLLDAERAVEEADRIGMVQGVDREVRRREAARREQRAEHEDRLVAALPRLGERDAREEAGSRLGDARVRACPDRGVGRDERGVVRERVGNGRVERQRRPGPEAHGHPGPGAPGPAARHVEPSPPEMQPGADW